MKYMFTCQLDTRHHTQSSRHTYITPIIFILAHRQLWSLINTFRFKTRNAKVIVYRPVAIMATYELFITCERN